MIGFVATFEEKGRSLCLESGGVKDIKREHIRV